MQHEEKNFNLWMLRSVCTSRCANVQRDMEAERQYLYGEIIESSGGFGANVNNGRLLLSLT